MPASAGMTQAASRARETQPSSVLRMQLVGANPKPQISGVDELPGKVNYLRGNDPKQWRTNIPTYAKVKYEKVYPGIDLIYYGNQRQLEHDFVVAPGADPRAIRLAFAGAEKLAIDGQGDLVLKTAGGDARLRKPRLYQEINGQQREIAGRYVLHAAKSRAKAQVGFQVAAYHKDMPLIIDPVLVYAGYLGGTGFDAGRDIAVDAAGNAYVTGGTHSTEASFPVLGGPDLTYNGGFMDAFVAKISDTAPPPPQPVLSVTPLSLDFGTVDVGSSKDLEFTVTNTGEDTLTGTASTSAPFSIVSGGSYSLSAGTSQTVVVRFAPTAAGSFAGNVNFESNAGNASQVVTGTTSSLSISQLSIFPVGGSAGDPIVQGVANSTQAVIVNTSDATIPAGTAVSVGLFALDNESRVLQPTAFQTTLPQLLPSESVTVSSPSDNPFKILSTKTTNVTLLVTNDSIGTTAHTTPMFIDRDLTEERHCLLEIPSLVTGALCASYFPAQNS